MAADPDAGWPSGPGHPTDTGAAGRGWGEAEGDGYGYPSRGAGEYEPRRAAGVDPRYEESRHSGPGYGDPRRGDPRYDDPRFDDLRRGDPERGDTGYGDPRYGDPRYQDPRFDDLRYGGGPGGDPGYGGQPGYGGPDRGGDTYPPAGYGPGGYRTGAFPAQPDDDPLAGQGPATGQIPAVDGWPGWQGDAETTGGRSRRDGPVPGIPGPRDRGRSKRRSGGRGRTVLALFLAVALLGGLAGAALLGVDRIRAFFTAPDYAGAGTGSVVVQVKQDETATDVGNTLAGKGVVRSAQAFIDAAKADSRSKRLEPGFYKLRLKMRAKDALSMLLARDGQGNLINRVSHKVTIPEGQSVKQTLDLLAKATNIPLADFQAAAKNPLALGIPDWWFKRQDGKQSAATLEGFLFPETYDFDPNASATDILKSMVNQFLAVADQIGFVNTVQQQRKISPYEGLIVASLAQAEAGNADDLGKVARVAYNRVYSGSFPCNCLQFDVTLNYWLELNGKPRKASKDMTTAELNDPNDPYAGNKPGLPPGPIDNPGKAALQAAMSPPAGNWLYFVAIDKQGHSVFSATLAEQQANERKSCAAKIIC